MQHKYDFDKVVERRGTGAVKWDAVPEGSIPLWVADMDFAAPPAVVDALRHRIEHPVFGYTHVSASYLEAFISWQQDRNGWGLRTSDIIPAPGVMPAIRFAVDAFTERGDTVIVQPPVYFPFYRVVEGRGRLLARNRLKEVDGSFRIDFDGLDRLCGEGARMLILCSPHNPVARVWREDELSEIARICASHDVLVVSDEIHSDIIMPEHRFLPFVPAAKSAGCRALGIQSPSKTFNIAGLASCTAIASDEETGKQFRGTLLAGNLELPNLLSLVAAEAAYSQAADWLDQLIGYLDANFRFLESYVEERVPGVRVFPLEGTYIAWLDFRDTGLSDDDLDARLKREARVRLNEGRQFGDGGSGFQRLNFACPRPLLEKGLERIERAFRQTGRQA